MTLHRKLAVERQLHSREEMGDLKLWRAVFCEFFGTFILLFVGLSNIVANESNDQIDNLLTPAFTFAAIIMTLIHIIGPTSGCHMNPAVTVSLMAIKRCDFRKGLLYITAQPVGAIAGSALTYLLSPPDWTHKAHLGINKLNPDLNMGQGLVMEVVGTMILVLLVLVISDPDPKKDFEGFPSLSAGMAVLACVLFMGPCTGAGLNPARSLGPAVVMGEFDNFFWIYIVGPCLGGLLADALYLLFLQQGLHKLDQVQKESELENEDVLKDKNKDKSSDFDHVKLNVDDESNKLLSKDLNKVDEK